MIEILVISVKYLNQNSYNCIHKLNNLKMDMESSYSKLKQNVDMYTVPQGAS